MSWMFAISRRLAGVSFLTLTIAFAWALVMPGPTRAESAKPTQDEVVALTRKAVEIIETQGVEAAREIFDKDGEFKFGEIYVNVGRREGARAADFLRLLTEGAGIDKASIRRIRVRERNAVVSVRKDDVA